MRQRISSDPAALAATRPNTELRPAERDAFIQSLMSSVPAGSRIWLVAGITDIRNGFNGLASKVQNVLKDTPLLRTPVHLPVNINTILASCLLIFHASRTPETPASGGA